MPMIRKIHLDFHTESSVRDVGTAFDPAAFAETLASAHVNYLATPGKCQFGHAYYETRIGRPHPGLVHSDLFAETVRACTAKGIQVQAYFTLGLDDVAAERFPEWRQRFADGQHAEWGAKHICFASPYIRRVVIPEVRELLSACPEISGFWFDICLQVPGAFYSTFFDEWARTELGDRADGHEARWHLARRIIALRCRELSLAIHAVKPDAENYFNSLASFAEPENLHFNADQEVENPIRFGGPAVLTGMARWYRAKGHRPIALVSRFNGPWMDPGTLRSPDQLRFDVARSVALGCHVSMGDHRHPDGTLNAEVYARLKPLYHELRQMESLLESATPCREALLVSHIEQGSDRLSPCMPEVVKHTASVLERAGIQFDITSVDDPLPQSDLIVWLGHESPPEHLRASFAAHLRQGGAVLAFGNVDGCQQMFGLDAACDTNLTPSLRPTADFAGQVTTNRPQLHPDQSGRLFRLREGLFSDQFVHSVAGSIHALKTSPDATVLAYIHSSASERPACPQQRLVGTAICSRARAVYSAVPLFHEHHASKSSSILNVITQLLNYLRGTLLVQHTGGPSIVPHLHRVKAGYLLHLVHWAMDSYGPELDVVPVFPTLSEITVRIRTDTPISEVRLPASGMTLPFKQNDGFCEFVIPSLRIWQVVEFLAEDDRQTI